MTEIVKSIFSRIIEGEIPCHKVYEDEKTLAFMDIHPAQPGHVLVVSKIQVDHLEDLEDADYQALWQAVRLVARKIRSELQPKRVGIHVEGFDVPHAHVHVLPINHGYGDFMPADGSQEPDHQALAVMAKRLAL